MIIVAFLALLHFNIAYVEKLILNAVSPEKKVVLGQIFNNNYARYRSVSPIKRLKENDYTLGFKNLVQRPSVSLRRRKYKKSLSELKYQPNQSATIKKRKYMILVLIINFIMI